MCRHFCMWISKMLRLCRNVIYSYEKKGNKLRLLCHLWKGRRGWSAVSFIVNCVGIAEGVRCWSLIFTIFCLQGVIWNSLLRTWLIFGVNEFLSQEHFLTTTLTGEYLDIRSNHLPEAIKQFTQHLFFFQELFS